MVHKLFTPNPSFQLDPQLFLLKMEIAENPVKCSSDDTTG